MYGIAPLSINGELLLVTVVRVATKEDGYGGAADVFICHHDSVNKGYPFACQIDPRYIDQRTHKMLAN